MSKLVDTPVASITEYNRSSGKRENQIYIFYDNSERIYHLRGYAGNIERETYSYKFGHNDEIMDFVRFVTDTKVNLYTYCLINASSLPTDSNEITSELLDDYQNNWISAYEKMKFSPRRIRQLMNIVYGMRFR